jgi:hypothetical protein
MHITDRITTSPPASFRTIPVERSLVPISTATEVLDINSPEIGRKYGDDRNHSATGNAAQLLFTRHASPSQLTEVSLDLYAMGLVSFEDYSALASHVELNPNYDRTVGALTGERAAPDRKRDLVSEWESKHDFLLRNSPENKALIDQAARISGLLRALARKTNLHV